MMTYIQIMSQASLVESVEMKQRGRDQHFQHKTEAKQMRAYEKQSDWMCVSHKMHANHVLPLTTFSQSTAQTF